jgi:mRNA interferase RelE/StbE
MLWPAFNELNDLSVGISGATLADVIAHFGHDTAQRAVRTARLEHTYKLARRTDAVQRLSSSGGYVTNVLQGSKSACRIRVGDYRVVYNVVLSTLIMQIIRVGHRRDIYNR